jgi:acyl-CoA dehydrogenase
VLGLAISLLSDIILCVIVGLLLATIRARPWVWAVALVLLTLGFQAGLPQWSIKMTAPGPFGWLAWALALSFCAISLPPLRRAVLIAPLFRALRRRLSRVSETVRQTLAGGTVGFERELFGGGPDWSKLHTLIILTDEERAFFNGPTDELCRMADDWQIRHEQEIPEAIWTFLKAKGFFGLHISKRYGGLEFSVQALSLIFGKIASRSPDLFGIAMTLNSLGLGELIETQLLVWGGDDPFQTVDYAERYAREIPETRLVRIKSAGHIPMENDPKAVAGALAEFFAAER